MLSALFNDTLVRRLLLRKQPRGNQTVTVEVQFQSVYFPNAHRNKHVMVLGPSLNSPGTKAIKPPVCPKIIQSRDGSSF